ncbi:MAG: HAD family hydrolase [Candidatus Saccharimonadales bacterium]
MIPDTILFDIGGVLSHDGHETYLTDSVYGLLRKFDIPNQVIFEKTAPVFRKYAVLQEANELDFWDEISQALGVEITSKDIQTVKRRLDCTNHEAAAAFRLLKDRGIRIGIISNSTPFFYPQMARSLSLAEYTDSSFSFLSYEAGRLKSGGLFELAAAKAYPPKTFIIDDRLKNVTYAQNLGFTSEQYSITSGESLLALVREVVDPPKLKGTEVCKH